MSATPIVGGFHPDPSVCRVGDDYYLVNSSFEYLPGVPIFRSRDLVAWQLIGNVLDREDQLVLPSSAGSSGIFAPTIRHHDGRFFMITTSINTVSDGHLIVSATDPAGPWTTPVQTRGAVGIDPDLFWDEDGTCYLTWASGWGETPIMQVVIDPGTGTLHSEPRGLSRGTGLAHPEGPHIYRRGDWYYLLLAEGGTERGHTVTISRSRTVAGPYEGNPANPILSHRSTADPVQNTGHADLVETADGWAMVYLGVRPVGPSPSFHLNGRETFLAGVEWVDDWPVVDETAFEVQPRDTSLEDDFPSPELDRRWIAPGRHPREFVSAGPDGGVAIQPSPSPEHRSLLAIRVEDQNWDARATVAAGTARLVLRLDDSHWAAVESQGGAVSARVVMGPADQTLASTPGPGSPDVTLAIRATQPAPEPWGRMAAADNLELGYVIGQDFQVLASIDGRYFSTEVAGGFTGRVVGVEPLPGRADPAILRRFEYRAL
ncbi:glycoside hydrolase family 43 protein [Microbacterium deminutum]|uniref:Glycoside hydrolase family 43 protein n=1 Tax=Microbacterium deminutum TaxID=344164 RepID=A0ABN2QJ99_9MICO